MSATPNPQPPSVERIVRWGAWAVFALALGLRLIGIGWGLPDAQRHWSYHPDEPINWMVSQQVDPAHGDFDPGFYNYGTLYFSILRVANDLVEVYGGAPSADDPEALSKRMAQGHMAGRLISAISGAAVAPLVFLMLRKRVRPFAAVLGALVPVVAPGFVIHSRFQTVDALATLLFAASLYQALKLLPDEGGDAAPGAALRAAILSGLFAGLGGGTKYTGMVAILALVVALACHRREGAARLAFGAAMATIAGFFIGTPGALLNSQAFLRDFSYELGHSTSGHGLVFVDRGSAFAVQLVNLAAGVGTLILLLGVLGLLIPRAETRLATLTLAVPSLAYYFLIGGSQVMFLRYSFPLLPVIAFGFGCLMHRASTEWKWGVGVVALGIIALGGLDGAGLRMAAQATVWMAGKDPRRAAGDFLKRRLAQSNEATVGLVSDPWFYTPDLFPDAQAPRPVFVAQMGTIFEQARAARCVQYVPENPSERFAWDRRLIDELRPRYIVFTNFEAEDLERLKRRSELRPDVKLQVERYVAFLDRLKEEYSIAAVFGGGMPQIHDLEYVRPTIWIWEKKRKP